MKAKVKKLDAKAQLPIPASDGAACADVVATSVVYDENAAVVTVGLGFATEIPENYKGIIVPRSSLTKTGWIMANSPAQIDSDYRGEWMIKFSPLHWADGFPYKPGDRVAQVYFEKVEPVSLVLVEELVETSRGAGGFGSTGK